MLKSGVIFGFHKMWANNILYGSTFRDDGKFSMHLHVVDGTV